VLVGGATGLHVGSLYDLDEMDQTDSVLGEISKTVRPEHTAVLARVGEQTPEAIDLTMPQLGGMVLRRDVYDVEAELAAAKEAQREAKPALRSASATSEKSCSRTIKPFCIVMTNPYRESNSTPLPRARSWTWLMKTITSPASTISSGLFSIHSHASRMSAVHSRRPACPRYTRCIPAACHSRGGSY
jgi:hypothetical protein